METAKKKSLGNNSAGGSGRMKENEMGEDEVRQGVRGLRNLVWLACEKTEQSKVDGMKTQRSTVPLKQIAITNSNLALE